MLYYISHLLYYFFTIYLKVTMTRLNWRDIKCGNSTILGESLVKETDGGGRNTTQCLFSSDLHFP